jgi:hypothetical protein
VRKICEEVVTSQLDGKKWANEEETVWTVSITEKVKAKVRSASEK